MKLCHSLYEGLKILGFDKETIKRTGREKHLEDIFLSTLFLNYMLILALYLIIIIIGGDIIYQGRVLNLPVLFGLMLAYPFIFNVITYLIYFIFAATAEVLDKRKTIKPILCIGFHTAFAYGVLAFLVIFLSYFNIISAKFVLLVFFFYFLYSMFVNISTIYEFSLEKTLLCLFLPFFFFGLLILCFGLLFPNLITDIFLNLFISS